MRRASDAHMPGWRSSSTRELVDFTLSCLWELEALRERQERLVLDALAHQDPDEEGDAPRWHQDLQDAALQQQMVHLSTEDHLDHTPPAGYLEQSVNPPFPRSSRSSPSLSGYRSLEDARVPDPAPRPFLPRSVSAPYTCLEGIAEGTEEEEDVALPPGSREGPRPVKPPRTLETDPVGPDYRHGYAGSAGPARRVEAARRGGRSRWGGRESATLPDPHAVGRPWSSSTDLGWGGAEAYHTLPWPRPPPDPRGDESDLSEAWSPGSGSDPDLVWPLRVPPRGSSISQNPPGSAVRIKASHALKRRILRFRSGSLRVMTTV